MAFQNPRPVLFRFLEERVAVDVVHEHDPEHGGQSRDPWKLDFAFNASFAALKVSKFMMKRRGKDYSISNFKELMVNSFLMKRFFPDFVTHF